MSTIEVEKRQEILKGGEPIYHVYLKGDNLGGLYYLKRKDLEGIIKDLQQILAKEK